MLFRSEREPTFGMPFTGGALEKSPAGKGPGATWSCGGVAVAGRSAGLTFGADAISTVALAPAGRSAANRHKAAKNATQTRRRPRTPDPLTRTTRCTRTNVGSVRAGIYAPCPFVVKENLGRFSARSTHAHRSVTARENSTGRSIVTRAARDHARETPARAAGSEVEARPVDDAITARDSSHSGPAAQRSSRRRAPSRQ